MKIHGNIEKDSCLAERDFIALRLSYFDILLHDLQQNLNSYSNPTFEAYTDSRIEFSSAGKPLFFVASE